MNHFKVMHLYDLKVTTFILASLSSPFGPFLTIILPQIEAMAATKLQRSKLNSTKKIELKLPRVLCELNVNFKKQILNSEVELLHNTAA